MIATTQKKERESRVEVNILGDRYTIRGQADTGYIAEVARMVDTRMREIKDRNREMNKVRVAVLAAINLADELLQERENRQDVPEDDEILRRTRQLISLLDEGLIGDQFD